MYICMDNYCLLYDYIYGRILYLRQFVEMYVTVVFVMLFVHRSEFNSYYKMALYKIKYINNTHRNTCFVFTFRRHSPRKLLKSLVTDSRSAGPHRKLRWTKLKQTFMCSDQN